MAEIAAPTRTSRPLRGVLLMCTACALFPIMNGIVKLLAATYEPQQIVWFRIVSHLVLVAAVFMPRMGLGLLRTRRIGHAVRELGDDAAVDAVLLLSGEVHPGRRGDLGYLRGAACGGAVGVAAAG